MMQFVNPIWLWALTGLSIPVAIHLLSRKEGQVIRIGSLRHLHETNTQQFKGIRLNEIVLLTLRCLMIILFVLLISGLRFSSGSKSETKWALVESGLGNNPEVKSQLQNFQNQGYELRWLAEGFPILEDSASVHTPVAYWKMLEELKEQNLSEVIIFSKSRVEGFQGKRPSLPSNIRWISINTEPSNYILSAITMKDSIAIRTGYTSPEETHFTTQVLSASEMEREPMDTIPVAIVADNAYQYDKKIVVAALKAIDQSFPVEIKLVNAPNEASWCIWLSDQPIPDSTSSQVMYLNPGLANDILLQETTNQWAITKRLNEEIALNENLTIQLATILIPSEKLWKSASQNDSRMLPEERAWSTTSDEKELASFSTHSTESYLITLLLITLLIERILAFYRNQ